MKIEKTQKENNLSDVAINLEPEDYKDEYIKKIKQLGQSVNIPGFRPGKAPMSLLEKRYKASVLSEEVLQKAYNIFEDYLKENGISYVGEPIINPNDADFEKDTTFTINFQFIELPDLEIDFPEDLEITKYNFKITDEQLNKVIDNMRKEFAEMKDANSLDGADYAFVNIELDDPEVKKFINIDLKNETNLKLDSIKDLTSENPLEINLLDLFNSVEDANNYLFPDDPKIVDGDKKINVSLLFAFTNKLPELDKDFFDKVFPNKNIQSEEEFRSVISEILAKNYYDASLTNMVDQLTDYFLSQYSVDLPKDILYDQIVKANKNKKDGLSEEQIAANLDSFIENIKREHFTNLLAKKYDIKIEMDDYEEHVASMYNLSHEEMDADESKHEMVHHAMEHLFEDQNSFEEARVNILAKKIANIIIEKCKIIEKEITYDDFLELQKNKETASKENIEDKE